MAPSLHPSIHPSNYPIISLIFNWNCIFHSSLFSPSISHSSFSIHSSSFIFFHILLLCIHFLSYSSSSFLYYLSIIHFCIHKFHPLYLSCLLYLAPGPPRNVTWVFIGNNELNVSWLPPEFPNGIITSYVVTFLFSNDSQTQHTVNGNESMLIVTRPSLDFSITVFAVNGAGESSPQNGTMSKFIDDLSMLCYLHKNWSHS